MSERGRGRFYVTRHWRGELALWVSLIVNSVVPLPAVVGGGTLALVYAALDHGPDARIAMSLALMAFIVALWLWQVVGVWRSGSRSRGRGGWWISRWSARLVVLGLGVIPVWYVSLMCGGLPQLEAMASDTDAIGQAGYTIALEGERIVVDGAMAWTMAGRFAAALDANPGVTTVVLTSNGGHEQVGRRMADEVIARGLDTLVTERCGSACTYVFASGRERLLARGARLGFHAGSPVFNNDAHLLVRLATERMRAYLVRIDVPASFIEKIESTPPSEAWIPSERELVEANIVTRVVELPD